MISIPHRFTLLPLVALTLSLAAEPAISAPTFFRNGVTDNYSTSLYHQKTTTLSLQKLLQDIEQRIGSITYIGNTSSVDNSRMVRFRLKVLQSALNNIRLLIASPGAVATNQPAVLVSKMVDDFVHTTQGMKARLVTSPLLTAQIAAVFAYAEEALFVFHKIAERVTVGLFWHEYSPGLHDALQNLQAMTRTLLSHPQMVGLMPHVLSDLDDELARRITDLTHYPAERSTFESLHLRFRQVLYKFRLNQLRGHLGLTRDSFPEARQLESGYGPNG